MKKSLPYILFAVSVTVVAGPIIYEPFDYAEGIIDGSQAGGTGLSATGWATSGSDFYQSVITPGLDFPGLETQGNALRREDRVGASEAHRGILESSQTALTADNSTIWFSLLLDTETSYTKANNLTLLFGTDAITVPKDLITVVDEISRQRGISRSKFISIVLRERINNEKDKQLKDAYNKVFAEDSIKKEQLETAEWFDGAGNKEGQGW